MPWAITENDVYVRVFDEILNELDHELVGTEMCDSYSQLSVHSRYLTTRMYIRQPRWIRVEDFENFMDREILDSVLAELAEFQWIAGSPSVFSLITDVATQKELMHAAKQMGLKLAAATRHKLVESLLQLAKQQQKQQFSTKKSVKLAELLPIECYFLNVDKREFLFKLEQMFLYPIGPDAELSIIYLSHMKKHSFMHYDYVKQRDAPLFTDRVAFDAYAEARHVCIPIELAVAATASKIPENLLCNPHLNALEAALAAADQAEHPQAAHVLARGVFNTTVLFMKAHRFNEEYEWIKKYLDCGQHHRSKRGLALIRKLLLEIRFLTESGTKGESSWLVGAINTYYDAQNEVNDIESRDLVRKTTKLLAGIRNTGLKSALAAIQPSSIPVINIPRYEVYGVPLKRVETPEQTVPGKLNYRLTFESDFNVEQTALLHYPEYTGGHFENSIMLTILWLLSYDLLFSDKQQFRCAYQSHPMNLQRAIDDNRAAIDHRLNKIEEYVIHNRALLYQQPPPLVGGINWRIPEQSVIGVMSGLGNDKTRVILERIMSNYRKYSSGFPDLTLWRPGNVKFVEVKSENDTVSDNQMVWMEFLYTNGIDVEVCRVASKPKKRKRS